MAFQMIHPYPCQIPGKGVGLGETEPDQQTSHKTGTLGDGQSVDIVGTQTGIAQRLIDHRPDRFDMLTRRQFRYHPPIGVVDLDLRGHHGREHRAPILDNGRGCLITRSFNTEYDHLFDLQLNGLHTAPRHSSEHAM
jgi:hypothetical protein